MAVQLLQRADASMGLQGTDNDAGAFIFVNIPYTATSPLTQTAVVLPRRCVLQSISFVTDAAATNAVTFQVWKAASTVALAAGTLLNTGTGSLQAVANTHTSLAVSATAGALDIASGNRVGVVISGALGAAGSGVITLCLNPA